MPECKHGTLLSYEPCAQCALEDNEPSAGAGVIPTVATCPVVPSPLSGFTEQASARAEHGRKTAGLISFIDALNLEQQVSDASEPSAAQGQVALKDEARKIEETGSHAPGSAPAAGPSDMHEP